MRSPRAPSFARGSLSPANSPSQRGGKTFPAKVVDVLRLNGVSDDENWRAGWIILDRVISAVKMSRVPKLSRRGTRLSFVLSPRGRKFPGARQSPRDRSAADRSRLVNEAASCAHPVCRSRDNYRHGPPVTARASLVRAIRALFASPTTVRINTTACRRRHCRF